MRLVSPRLIGGLSALALALLAQAAWSETSSTADASAASGVDRVGFPGDYRANLALIRHDFAKGKNLVITVYANQPAAMVSDLSQLPYPAGSVLVFEWAAPVPDESGQPRKESDGSYAKGIVTRIDVMRHEPGYGAAYGEKRAGEWEFASYHPDGRAMEIPEGAVSCAACHRQAAPRDFVFRGRFPKIEKSP